MTLVAANEVVSQKALAYSQVKNSAQVHWGLKWEIWKSPWVTMVWMIRGYPDLRKPPTHTMQSPAFHWSTDSAGVDGCGLWCKLPHYGGPSAFCLCSKPYMAISQYPGYVPLNSWFWTIPTYLDFRWVLRWFSRPCHESRAFFIDRHPRLFVIFSPEKVSKSGWSNYAKTAT